MSKYIIVALYVIALLVVSACASEVETVTTTLTQPATTVTQPATTQPQVITSPDEKVQITSHDYQEQLNLDVSKKMGLMRWIAGRVENISASAVRAEIKVEFYNHASELIETQTVIVSLDPGASKPFAVYSGGITWGDYNFEWDSCIYKISVSTVS
jgi:hypothetical protein